MISKLPARIKAYHIIFSNCALKIFGLKCNKREIAKRVKDRDWKLCQLLGVKSRSELCPLEKMKVKRGCNN